MRGRKSAPTALKILRGNPGKRSLPEHEPQPEIAAPEPPIFLSDYARAEWARLVPELLQIRVLSRIDRDTLAAYCDALAEWKEATEEIEKHGLFTTSSQGSEMAHPAVAIRRNAREHVRKFAALFGLSPADRTRIHALPQKEAAQSPLERLRPPLRIG